VSCVHRRVLFWRVNANCDIYGYVERSGPVSLYGRGDRVYGSVPIYGALEGQGANRFTARIHGETEASVTIEAEARPELNRDWSLALNFNDGFRWSEPAVLHVMGREIPLSKYAEPRIRAKLGAVRERALAAARRLDLHDKAETAWRHAFEPVQLSDNPQVWLQLTPQSAAFAGVRAEGRVLRGSLELSGSGRNHGRTATAGRHADGIARARPRCQRAGHVRRDPARPRRLRRAEGQDHAGNRHTRAGCGPFGPGCRGLSVVGQARHRPARCKDLRQRAETPGGGPISRARFKSMPTATRSGLPISRPRRTTRDWRA
jgi:hypothetical protein